MRVFVNFAFDSHTRTGTMCPSSPGHRVFPGGAGSRRGNQLGANAVMRYLGIFVVLASVSFTLLFKVPIGHGKPLLGWQQARDNWTQPARWLTTAWPNSGNGQQRIYRWRDATGSWQYGRIPPPGVKVRTVDLKAPTVVTAEKIGGKEHRRRKNKRKPMEAE